MTKEQTMLASTLAACRQRIEKLSYSLQKNAPLFPLRSLCKTPFTLSLSKGSSNQIKDFDRLSPNGIGLCRMSLTLTQLVTLTEAQEEFIDALILRYSQCVSSMQDQLFRAIAHAEQEDISDKSNRDKAMAALKI